MWVIEVQNPGKESRLVKGQRPVPDILANEVLIKTHAAGINRADIFQRNGLYAPPPGASDILGLEVSGTIEKVGTGVKNFFIGEKVCALLEGGGYAEYVKVNAAQVLPIPKNLNFIEAASLPEALFTAYSNIFHHGQMQPGESLLIHGGASGVGVFAVQIAKAFGIKCFTTAGTDEKCQFLEKLGAECAINYKNADFVEVIKEKTGGAGVDCVIDMVGGSYFNRNLRCLAQNGRLISIAFLEGAKVEANLAPMLFKNITVMGTTLRNKPLDKKAIIAYELKNNIWKLIENGSIKPIIHASFSMDEAEKAHALMESGKHTGKIILKCDQ